eukprot:scaffold3821_cov127-Cylindrotheca_fusiformis.AAC.14
MEKNVFVVLNPSINWGHQDGRKHAHLFTIRTHSNEWGAKHGPGHEDSGLPGISMKINVNGRARQLAAA